MFLVSCMATFFWRTRPASSIVKPAAIQNTRKPQTRNIKLVKIKPISDIGGVASASCARPSVGSTISAAATGSILLKVICLFPFYDLDRVFVGFTGAHAHRTLHIQNENLAVPNFVSFCRAGDGLHDLIRHLRAHNYFELYFWHKIYSIFCTTINFGMTRLCAEAFDFCHHHSAYANGSQCLTDLLELERFDCCDNKFHACPFQFSSLGWLLSDLRKSGQGAHLKTSTTEFRVHMQHFA